jgi:protein TonB
MREGAYDRFGGGMAAAVVLHVLIAAAIVAAAWVAPFHMDHFGGDQSSEGAIQASMVDALPLPPKAAPVKDQVLAQPNVTEAPATPPKEAAAPKDTDILVRGKPATKTAPVETPVPPKHAQPTPATTKATSGASATQIPQSIQQNKNGSAALTVQDHVFGQRYAYYFDAVQRIILQNWQVQEAGPGTVGKQVKLIFDINADGVPQNVRVEVSSGSPSLDASAVHALQRVDSFGPLPMGSKTTVEDTFIDHPQ